MAMIQDFYKLGLVYFIKIMSIKIAMCLNVLETSDNHKPNTDFCETLEQFPFYINNIKIK